MCESTTVFPLEYTRVWTKWGLILFPDERVHQLARLNMDNYFRIMTIFLRRDRSLYIYPYQKSLNALVEALLTVNLTVNVTGLFIGLSYYTHRSSVLLHDGKPGRNLHSVVSRCMIYGNLSPDDNCMEISFIALIHGENKISVTISPST